MTKQNCPLCNQVIETNLLTGGIYRSHDCPCCGFFVLRDTQNDIAQIKNETASYFYYTGNRSFLKKDDAPRTIFVGLKDYFEREYSQYDNVYFVTKEEILAFYPKSFNERVTHILLGLARQSKFLGDSIHLTREEMISALFIKRYSDDNSLLSDTFIGSQAGAIINYLENNRLVDAGGGMCSSNSIKLLPEGWKRVDELQKNNPDNRNIFIAMAFPDKESDKKPKDLSDIKDAIKEGITEAQYNPIIMCDTIHGEQIVPKMFRLIRESRLLVMDVTYPNLGAYHEAGFALGLGKEVIITCREVEYKNPDNKPHFDIAQRQILVWKDYNDLIEKLPEWIKEIAR